MIEDILAQADADIDAEGEKPEEEKEDPVSSLLKQADEQIALEEKPKPKKVLVPGMDMPMGIGTPMQEEQVQEAEAVAPKPEIKELNDPVDILLQMSQGNYDDPKIYQWRDTLNQEQLAKLAERDPAFPLTDSQDRMAYDYLRKQSPFKIPRTFYDWYGIAEYAAGMVPKIAEPIAQSAVGFAKGAYKFGKGLAEYATAENFAWKDAYEKLPDDSKERVREQLGSIPGGFFNPRALPDAEIAKIVFSEVPEEERKQYQKRVEEGTEAGRTAVYSALEPIVGLPISMAETATKIGTGGISAWDRLTESIGLRTYDDSFENWRNRRLFDSAMQQWNATRPNSYAKALEVMSPAIVAIAKADGPTVEDYMREEGLTREQAELARDYDAEQWTLDSINKVQQEDIPAIDEDIRTFGEFALPAGFGLDQFGYAMNLARVGSWATPRLYAKLRLAGMTPEQVNKYYSDRINAAEKWAEDKFKRKTKQGVVEKAAGAADDQIRRMQAAMDQSAFWKRVRQAAPYVAGGAVSYGVTEDPLAVLYGPLAGRLAVSFPGFLRDWQEARRLSAGGRQGQFATLAEIRQDRANNAPGARKFDPEARPTIKLKGSISERIQDFGGEKLDNIVDNIGEYVRMGVQPTVLGIGVGAVNSYDDEELGSTIGMGLFYSLGGRGLQQVKNKVFGTLDPVIEQRKLRQDMNDLQKLYRDASPEARTQIDRLSDWNTVVDAKRRALLEAQKRLQEAEANAKKVAEGDPTKFRSPSDTISETAAASEKVSEAKRTVELRQATLDRVQRANVQTRNEYSRQWLRNLARLNILGNGTLREGMNNVGINVISSREIYKILRRNPANAAIPNERLWETATQSGFYGTPDGTTVFKPGSNLNQVEARITFDANKPSVVVNADYIRDTAGRTGQLPIFALNHEFAHHLKNVPEYAELIKDAESMLFAQDVKDLSGKTVAVTPGKYSVDDLLDMYWNRYLAGYTKVEKTDFARMNGLLDENTGQLKRDETAAYMRNEIMADLGAESVSRFIDPQKDGGIRDIYDRALLKFRTKRLARFVDKLRRAGGTGDIIADNTGAALSPDVMQVAVDAMKAYDSLKNQVSPAVPQPERPKITRAQMMRDRSLLARYGADSPLFSTSVKAQIFDASGNPVGTSIPIDMKDPALSEGVWERTETGVKQIGGYGRLSRQIDLAGIPVGSRIVISNQIDFQPDGVTPVVLSPREAKKRGQNRAQIIRAALDNTPDYGAPNRFQPVAPGSDTYRGTFTPMQIQALQNIPESVVPKSIKERILAFNQALARNDGTRMIVDYAAVMTDSGKYQAFSPKIYDVVPIGMMFSKDGNFLVTTISVTRLFDKLNAWSERMPARLDFWQGSKDRFWKDFSEKYLANWQQGIPGSGYKNGKLVENARPLDADPEIAEQKKNIFNDFLNLFDNATEGLNVDRTVTPRRKGDARDKNIDRTIMSMRIDHVAEVLENPMGKLPIIYGYAKQNFLPKPKSNGEQAVPRKTIEGEQMPFRVVSQNRNPELQQAAQRLIRGEIDTADYQALVRDISPYEDLSEVPEPMSVEAMKEAIAGESRKAKVGVVRDVLKQNDEAESRIDIKAFEDFGQYVSTIHKPTKKEVGGEAAAPIAHESTVHLKDVKFMVNPTQSLEIAAGRSKGTIARIKGKWQDTTSEGAFELANEKFNDPEWVQLGMNPTRQSNFYIRSTGEPVKSADEVIQVGKFVLAKNPKKVTPEEMPERTMTDYGMQFLPRPKKADEGERKAPVLSVIEPPVRVVGPSGTVFEGVTAQYEPEARPLTGISFLPKPKPERYTFAYTVASDRVKLVDELIKAKNWQAIRELNQATVRHAMSDLPNVKYQVKDVLGAFENGREVSASIDVEIDSPETLVEVRKRMVALGELWKQTEVLEEKVGRGDINLLGTVDNDGFLHIPKYEIDFDKLTSSMVEKARLAAGIQSMTIDGNKVIFYDTDNTGAGFADRIAKFAASVTEGGGVVRGVTQDNAAIRSYRDPASVKPGSLYYNDDPVRLFGAGQLPDRLRSPVYQVVSELLGRPLPPPKDGRSSYFVKEDVTPKQVKLQNSIGNRMDSLVLNDKGNKDAIKAYEELNKELLKQFDALVAAGMRFEAAKDYDTLSKIYPNSNAVIKDIRENNNLLYLKTDPTTFGPTQNGKPMDFSFHPLLKDSGRTDAAGNKMNFNDILRVVHDAIAHGMYSTQFGPIGEESAWHTHIRTIDNPWARWALTMETRGQNSWVNYRDVRIGKDKMPLKPGDDGYVPLSEREFSEQKFGLLPLKYSLTGDSKVDKPIKELMEQIGAKRAEGSPSKRPDWMPSKAQEKQILSKIPQPAGNPKTMVADATAILGKPTKADEASSVPVIVSKEWVKKKAKKEDGEDDGEDAGETVTVGQAELKDVVTYGLTGLPIVVRPLPNYAAENNATKVAKNVLNIATNPTQYKDYTDRVVAAGEKVRNDPQRFVTLSGYLEFMRESGASGNLLMPPSQLAELVKNAQHILNLWNGGYHGTKTAPGTIKAAKDGLDGVNEMKSLFIENGVNLGPTPMITALHHLWGILSRQLDPLNQEGMWMRLVSNPAVIEQIQRSIDGEYNLTRDQWKAIVQQARKETKGEYSKIGNNATSNANAFALMLERHNGKWDQLASIYKLDDAVQMTNAFWGLNVGATGIKNKVQRFIGLTFGIHGSVLDRWRFVSLNLPMAMKLTGKQIPEAYFKYYGRNKTIPEDPVGIYKSYGTVENGNPVYSTALYTGIDRMIEGVIANSPALKNFLGVHATPGGFHWIDWNCVKNEAVGHSSLDLTKEFLKQKGRDATGEDFLDVVQNSTVYTRADQDGKILDLVMENGVFRIRED